MKDDDKEREAHRRRISRGVRQPGRGRPACRQRTETPEPDNRRMADRLRGL